MADNSDILNQISAEHREQSKDAPAPVAEKSDPAPVAEKPAAAPKTKAASAAEK